MKDLIANRLTGRDTDPFMLDNAHTGDAFECLQPVTEDEVRKLLSSMSSKSSLWTLCLPPYLNDTAEYSFPSLHAVKILGATLDSQHTFNKHVQNVC